MALTDLGDIEMDLGGPAGASQAEVAGLALQETAFSSLPGCEQDDYFEAFQAFRASCARIVENRPALRPAQPAAPALKAVCLPALQLNISNSFDAKHFFETQFRPFRVSGEAGTGFWTGYYEPFAEGSLDRSPEFTAAVYGQPDDLVRFPPGQTPQGPDPELSGARRRSDGTLEPCPARAAIEAGEIEARAQKIVFLRDLAEAFLIHVQGSARIKLQDGRLLRLVYAGRNGRPYTSIGRILIQTGEIAPEDMSLARLKSWIRAQGQAPGEHGFDLMARNESLIFFALENAAGPMAGPTGGAGASLTPLRSLAIDRSIWSYGLPFFINADLPWHGSGRAVEPFQRLMIAQDTGWAILGAARADIFFGTGEAAGQNAGDIRHSATFFVLLPRAEARGPGKSAP